MKRFKKESQAILGGMASAYLFQLFMVYVSTPESSLLIAEAFIPIPTIQFAIAPVVSWILMGLLRVRWFDMWIRISAHAFAFLFPFVMVAMIVLYINARLWHSLVFWGVNIAISLIASCTIFKPLAKVRLPEDSK